VRRLRQKTKMKVPDRGRSADFSKRLKYHVLLLLFNA
jgi:hypothetical protein